MEDLSFHWKFPARCYRVVDGDTLDMVIDVGMHATRLERVRLLRVNCPETHGPRAELSGQIAMDFTSDWIHDAVMSSAEMTFPFFVSTIKDPDNFGRYLVELIRRDTGANLSDDLLASGHAVPFHK